MGIRTISGVPFLPINNWRDFKKINKQLTDKKNLEKAKELYQTIIFDEVYTASKYCQDYICRIHGVETIGEGNGGFGLWKEYENEFFNELDKLMKAGFTLLFIGHEDKDRDTGQIIPKGDSRSMTPVRDNSDVVIYLTSNGVDEEGRVVKSSAWFAERPEFFARSRFDYIDTYLEEYTAENLEATIIKAIERQEEADGVEAVTYEEQKQMLHSEELDYDTLMAEVKEVGAKLQELDKLDDIYEISEKHIGKDAFVLECKKGQEQVIAVILDEMKDLLEELQ